MAAWAVPYTFTGRITSICVACTSAAYPSLGRSERCDSDHRSAAILRQRAPKTGGCEACNNVSSVCSHVGVRYFALKENVPALTVNTRLFDLTTA